MKIFFFIAGLLCLAGNCFAQHLFQIDDGHGNYLLIAPPPSLSGVQILSLPLPPISPMPAGFIGSGTLTGQIPIWNNSQLAWIAASPNTALNALLPNQAGNAGKVLFTDGTNTGWTAISAGGAVSVFGRTGIITPQTGDYNFTQISGSATANQLPNLQSMNGVLDIAHGGTGQITANAGLNTLLPSQTGNANKVLQTDGANTSWVAIPTAPVASVFGRTGIVIAANNDYSFSQISGSAAASQLPNLQSMNGLLDIAHGGTGQITANAALNALLPTQLGNNTKVLQTDGTNTSWVAIPSAPVASVFGRTGIVIAANNDYSFSQISGSATASQLPNLQSMNGLLDITHGGTGQLTANASLNALLPTQIGNANKVLQTDGANTSWVTLSPGGVTSAFGRTGAVIAANNDYSFTQISGSATASQLPNLQSMNGLLDIAHGGTGQITSNAALNALLPTQTGNANKVLQTDGTNTTWIGLISSPVSSVFGRTGVITSSSGDYSFSQLSGSATANQLPNLQSMNGLLDIAHGGTGQFTANAALNALLPTQTGNTNKILQTDGTNSSWVVIPSSPVASVFGRAGIVVATNNDYSFSQISGSATANQLPNLQSMNGLLDIAHGGTGQILANAALNALLPTQTGNANKVLQTDGTNTSWVIIPSAPVSSVFGRTGIIVAANNDYSFSQISGSATANQLPNLQSLNGLLDIAHGGTGQITANAALNALLPTQTGSANKILQTDGTNTSWITISPGGVTSVFGRTGTVVAANNDYSFSQISGSATANQLPNLQSMNGLLDIAHGGTGQITVNAALNALLPIQTGNANKVLQTDGTNTNWISIPSAPITSVFGRTGAVVAANNDYSFSQISGSAIASQLPNLQSMNGLLDIAHGGTGITSYTLGDMLYASAGTTLTIFSGNTSATKKFLTQTGTGSVSASPVWNTIAATDMPVMVASGASHSAGAVPDPGVTAGTTKFLREDGSWQIPAGGGTGTVTSVGLSMPGEFSTGAAITTSGNLSASWANQTTNKIFASPDGSTGTPAFRALTANDISGGMISYAKIQSVAPNSILGNNTGSSATILELSASQVKAMLALNNVENTALSTWAGSANITTLGTIGTGSWNANTIAVAKGGTGISSYTLGDMLYASAGTTLTIFSGNSSATKKFLTQTGTGSASAAPAWNTIAASDMPVMIASGASHSAGAVPDPGATAGTTKFLREDGSWQVPAGGGGSGVNYDVTSAQNVSTTSTDYLFNIAYSGSAGSANAAGAVINSTATGASNSGTGLSITADGGNSSSDKGIIVTTGDNSSTNLSSTGIVVTATATGTGTSKGLDITCSGGTNRVGLLLTDGHLQSKQTTVVTAAKQVKAGGTATTPTTTGCTDIAGKITMTVQGAGLGAGDQVKVTFNKAYVTAPIVVVTAGSLATVLANPYISAINTTDFTIALGSLPSSGDAEVYYYHVIETQ